MKARIYIETSVISNLCARPSRDLIVAANQEITREWWERDRGRYDCYVSALVLDEASSGDVCAAAKRRAVIAELKELAMDAATVGVARELLIRTRLPKRVTDDLAHIATAAVYGMDYLLTWNCAHIANPHWQPRVAAVLRELGYDGPMICTPQALLEGEER
ncbi:MAG: type II toxin-antitoxin system VapC family toxin [Candidatus Marinimicrobia bacterium]|nr:type II toxin-antitoxin system VapC family toxin [Candidatus Neomarinimicrobiota bacterium]